jgi:hypothetical protein
MSLIAGTIWLLFGVVIIWRVFALRIIHVLYDQKVQNVSITVKDIVAIVRIIIRIVHILVKRGWVLVMQAGFVLMLVVLYAEMENVRLIFLILGKNVMMATQLTVTDAAQHALLNQDTLAQA